MRLLFLVLGLVACGSGCGGPTSTPSSVPDGPGLQPDDIAIPRPDPAATMTPPPETACSLSAEPVPTRIAEPPPIDTGDALFDVAAPESVSMLPGSQIEVVVEVTRDEGADEPILVGLTDLEAGVISDPILIASGQTSAAMTITASAESAVPIPEQVWIRAEAASGTRSRALMLSVRAPFGTDDSSFGDVGSVTYTHFGTARSIAEQPDGKLLVTGSDDSHELTVCRLLLDGGKDPTFGDSGCARIELAIAPDEGSAWKVAIDHDGSILLLGRAIGFVVLAKLTESGALRPEFGDAGITIIDLGVQTEPRVLLPLLPSGYLIAGMPGFAIKLDASGAVDTSFATTSPVPSRVYDAVQLPNCSVVLSGTALVALDLNGNRDLGFGYNGTVSLPSYGFGITETETNLYVTGPGMVVESFGLTGEHLSTFPALDPGSGKVAQGTEVEQLPDGRFIIGGSFEAETVCVGFGLRNPNGSADLSFGPGGTRIYYCDGGGFDLLVQRDGRFVLAGAYSAQSMFIRIWN